MQKRVQKRRISKRGGYLGESVVNTVGQGLNTVGTGLNTYVVNPVTGAAEAVVDKTKEGAQGASSWFGSFFGNPGPNTAVVAVAPGQEVAVVGPAPAPPVPVSVPPAPAPSPSVPYVAAQSAGSRRRKRNGRKSKNMFSGLMKMVGFKTKKRGRRGGIGGPAQGYQQIVGANFPSAANAQGNNIYDLAPFDPSKPFTGGMKRVTKRVMEGGCMSKLVPLTPASYPSGVSNMFGGKTMRRRKRCGGKSKKHGW